MDTRNRFLRARGAVIFAAVLVIAGAAGARAAVTSYQATLDASHTGSGSSATGMAVVEVDPVAHTMRVQFTFTGLTSGTTAAHIHAPTLTAGTGTAAVATTTPYFPGFPTGVTSGSYDQTFDMTQSGSYNSAFITANGGTTASAETALFSYIAADKAYLNIHTSNFPGGEISGFLVATSTPLDQVTWGETKDAYH
jgi:hypothetical protein